MWVGCAVGYRRSGRRRRRRVRGISRMRGAGVCVCVKDMCSWGGEVAAELPTEDQDAAVKSPSSFFGAIDKMVSASSYIGLKCTSWKSSWMKRREGRRNMQWARR